MIKDRWAEIGQYKVYNTEDMLNQTTKKPTIYTDKKPVTREENEGLVDSFIITMSGTYLNT